jgi:hypothetical protein
VSLSARFVSIDENTGQLNIRLRKVTYARRDSNLHLSGADLPASSYMFQRRFHLIDLTIRRSMTRRLE